MIGLGAMGSRFAARLLGAGYRVHAFNRTPGRAPELDELGLVREPTPEAVAAAAEVVLLALWDSDSVSEAVRGTHGVLDGLLPGGVVVDLSTIDPVVSAMLAREVADRGGTMLDCPVSGSLDRAEAGQVLIMAGGPATALETALPILRTIASRVVPIGEANGAGLALKLAINAQVAVQLLGWGESLAITDEYGIDRGLASEVMLDSVVASPMLAFRVPFYLAEPEVVWASVELLRKDVGYALRTGTHRAVALARALALLDEIADAGRGDHEAAALIGQAAGDHAAMRRVSS
jgi:3-hydroxyisobutyrate dehydrogenase-like beta-hydroxyacid dehydrogenase